MSSAPLHSQKQFSKVQALTVLTQGAKINSYMILWYLMAYKSDLQVVDKTAKLGPKGTYFSLLLTEV